MGHVTKGKLPRAGYKGQVHQLPSFLPSERVTKDLLQCLREFKQTDVPIHSEEHIIYPAEVQYAKGDKRAAGDEDRAATTSSKEASSRVEVGTVQWSRQGDPWGDPQGIQGGS